MEEGKSSSDIHSGDIVLESVAASGDNQSVVVLDSGDKGEGSGDDDCVILGQNFNCLRIPPLVVEEVLALPPDEANLPGRLLDVVVVGSGLAPHDRGGRGGEDREEEEERDRSVRHRSRSSSRCGSGK